MRKIITICFLLMVASAKAQNHSGSHELHPSWSPQGDQLVIHTNLQGNDEIYTLQLDNLERKRITNHEADDQNPTWSPNGEWIAFHSNRNGNYDIFIIKTDGNELQQITVSDDHEMSPSWSPDSRFIAFEAKRDEQWEIEIVELNSKQITHLSNRKGDHLAAEWLPNGQGLIFSFTPTLGNHDTTLNLYTINTLGGQFQPLIKNSRGNSNASISKDGKYIVFNSIRDDNWEIYIKNSQTTNEKRLTKNELKTEGFPLLDIDGQPAISPDGKLIAFISGRSGNFDIYIMDINGNQKKNLTENWGGSD